MYINDNYIRHHSEDDLLFLMKLMAGIINNFIEKALKQSSVPSLCNVFEHIETLDILRTVELLL